MTERDPNLTARTSDLIELGDIDGLLVEVDRLCDEGQWGA